ncbi:hypothetical protein M5K25_016453 [Dendrobium thyrsiflorum]|uniref:Agenet domain-containing protein n=1 Tax=Dendrobium thyrsiflorum TaxID=117978 RepID=A0ABD0UJS3_DENTH
MKRYTSMDYDENDFRSQNFQLVGEDKFSVNLRSFPLPRFDLDEHLRFDCLVEEEVLLGIQGQENNWIDFPPGSSALEFSSSAAESCSIARHNNVWSEATSSESVDLLLKSVGEDELINDKVVIMDVSANDESHDIDNQVDLYVEKGDAHESSMMDILPVDPELTQDKHLKKFSHSNEVQWELLPNVQGSSQAAEGEESGIAMYEDLSNKNLSPDGKIDVGPYTMVDNISCFYNPIEKSKADEKGLCGTVPYEKDVCEVLLKTEVPHSDDSDSCVVDSQSLASNQDVKLDIEAEKLNTGLFYVGQDQRNTSNSSGFLCDDVHRDKSLVTNSEDKTNQKFASKSDALELPNTKCINSVFSVNSDGLVVSVPCLTKPLNDNSEASGKSFANEECKSLLAMEQEERIGHNSVTLKTQTELTEGPRSIDDGLLYDSMEDDDGHSIRTQLMKNSTVSCDDRGGKLETCMNAIDNNQDPESELVENKIDEIAIATQSLIKLPASIHVNHETQGTEIDDCERMRTNSLSFTFEKPGLVLEGNYDKIMDVERQELKLDENNDVAPVESSLTVAMTDESCLSVTMTVTESRISPSTFCKSSVQKDTISATDLREVHIEQVHASVNKKSSMTYISPSRINSDAVSNVMDKAQDLHPAIQDTAEELSLDGSANKFLEEDLGKKETSIQLSASNIIHFDSNDVKISGLSVSPLSTTDLIEEKESDVVSVSYPLNMKDISLGKISRGDSGAQLASLVKSPDSQPSKGTVGLNLATEQKGPSPCLTIPDSFDSEKSEMKLSGGSISSKSIRNVDKEGWAIAGSDCVEDTSTDHLPNAVVQPPSLVQSTDFAMPQNHTPSSAGNAVGSEKTLLLEGNGVSQGPSQEGKEDIPNSSEVVTHFGNEVSVALAQTTYGRQAVHMPPSIYKDGSCKSPSNDQSDQYKLSKRDVSDEQDVSAQTEGCHQDDLEHQVPKASGNMDLASSEKVEITLKADCSSNDLHGTSIEARSLILEVSTSGDFAGRGVGSEPSFLNLKGNDTQMPNANSQGLPEEVKMLDISMKTPNHGKSKNASRPSNEKKTVSKGKTKKEPHTLKQSSVMDLKSSTSTRKSVGILSKDVPLVEMREHSSIECSTVKTSSSVAFQTSIIPDLNSSSSLSLFHQPFTDLQQVQLRAQIFVYGALISGMPPDEAYMVSAFGGADGGRNLWEGVWHAWIVRFQSKKSPVGGYDTPTHSRPAIWIPEQVSMGNGVQSKVSSTSSSSDSSIMSSAVRNSTMPLPSPLWSHSHGNDGHHANISRGTYLNFSHTPSSLLHQTSVSRQHVGANSPWLSQSPRPGPWFVSSQISALDGITRYSTVSVPETVHVTPVRDSSGPHTPPSVLMSVPDTALATTIADLPVESSKKAVTSGNNKHTPTTQKARKRKKGVAAQETSFPASQTSAEPVSAVSDVRSLPLPSANLLLSSNSQLNVASPAPVLISTPHIISPTHYQIIGANNNLQKAILSEETCSKIEQAKHQAEDAAALAASTIKHSQDIWSQLASLKNSGLVSQIEEKLASAAVVAAVASSVTKAAAAAANVAVGAALQAKIMADEAMSVAKTGMDKIHGSGAIISAASEAARRRVELVSAATKRAENLDAIVKAAELAAEAVAQAGTIITMGDPLPFSLSQLVDAGPEGFWRGHDGSSTKLSKSRCMHEGEHSGSSSAKEHGGSAMQLDGQFSKNKETQKATDESGLSSLSEYHEQFERRVQGNFPIAGQERDPPVSSIQKGSVVEVMSDEDGQRGAWFSAQVLDINDNKAYVSYNDVSTTEGQLKEWIVLEEGEKAPRIRTAHSTTLVKYEGTRKRRREHLGSYIWEVGDHVDAWIHDRWWEGTITEKTPGDETKLTVHFPARTDKQAVHSWNLRPSRIWKDGQWMEWSHAKGKSNKQHEGDTPQEKRQRLGKREGKIHSEVEVAEMGNLSKNILVEESRKPDDSRSLVLSAKDRTFTIGKNSREEVISDALKPKQTSLQKEGSKVVFGVPRPGKKRKFMEVSKHYVANKSEKINEGSDAIKFAKYLMPQASRPSRNTLKVDNKGKKAVDIKPRGGFKAENSRSFQTRSLSEKDKASLSTSNEDTVQVPISSFGGSNNCLDKMNAFKVSFPSQDEKNDVSTIASEDSVQPAPASFSKKKKTSGSEPDFAVKSKFSVDRTSTLEDKGSKNPGKSLHEVLEPRRSNRRIQPTSRLLEGLQSSLVISKIPSISHERKSSRGGSSSRGNTHG